MDESGSTVVPAGPPKLKKITKKLACTYVCVS